MELGIKPQDFYELNREYRDDNSVNQCERYLINCGDLDKI